MATYARTPRPRRDKVRSRVLAAAATVFAQRGFAAATIDEVAAAAGFTKGAVFWNFTAKMSCSLSFMDAAVNARVELVRRVTTDAPTTPEALAEIGDRLARASIEQADWQLLFLEFWLRAVGSRRCVSSSSPIGERCGHRLPRRYERRPRTIKNLGKWPAEETTVLLLALSNGFAIESLADPESVPDGLFGRIRLPALQTACDDL